MPKSNKPWTHIPDTWIGAAISCRTTREDIDLIWAHLAKCEACRERYWEISQNAVKGKSQSAMTPMMAIPIHGDMGDLPAPLKAMLGALMGGHGGGGTHMTWGEAMLKMLAHVEQLGDEPLDQENMEIEGLIMPSGDLDHNEECKQCQTILKSYIEKLEERKVKMPDKLKVIEKTIAYFKSLLPEPKKKGKAAEKEPTTPSNGEPNSFAM